MTIEKYTEEQMEEIMENEGLEMEDISQYYRICFSCGLYVNVDDQSENICDMCNN